MLTDPVTTPEDKKHQAIFALLIALTASLLDPTISVLKVGIYLWLLLLYLQ